MKHVYVEVDYVEVDWSRRELVDANAVVTFISDLLSNE
jgi:hypothetical protein